MNSWAFSIEMGELNWLRWNHRSKVPPLPLGAKGTAIVTIKHHDVWTILHPKISKKSAFWETLESLFHPFFSPDYRWGVFIGGRHVHADDRWDSLNFDLDRYSVQWERGGCISSFCRHRVVVGVGGRESVAVIWKANIKRPRRPCCPGWLLQKIQMK